MNRRYRGLILCMLMLVLAVWMPGKAQAKTTNAKKYSLTNVAKAPEMAGEWVKVKSYIRYKTPAGKYVKSRWIRWKGDIYYVNAKGNRVTDWVTYRNKKYWLNKEGKVHFEWKGKTYYFKADGSMAKGKTVIGAETYYFNKSTGKRKTGLVTIGKNKYFFLVSTGTMAKNRWVLSAKKYYYAGPDGKILKSCWIKLSEGKYFVNSKGVRVTGEQYIDGQWYKFASNGKLIGILKLSSNINPNKPMVAITFDDGPGPYTGRLLDCLQKYKAKATFFMVGSSVSSYKSTVRRMASLGCELGNHSWDHARMTSLSSSGIHSQFSRTSSAIRSAAGKGPTVCRLPYGAGHNSSWVLNSTGLPSIYWSIDTMDWANTGNPQHTINAVIGHIRSGDIVLMHDIHRSTVIAAETIIPSLVRNGWQLVTVSELAKYKGKTSLHAGRTYYNFR